MAEVLHFTSGANRETVYRELLPQIEAVTGATTDLIANMANVAAILKAAFDFHWVGFYRATTPDKLTLGPFQGPLACVIIPFAKGVCGRAATTQKTVIVPDVEQFPGHIACSSLTRSEIVVPGVVEGKTVFVLDVESAAADDFNAVDQRYLEEIVGVLLKASHISSDGHRAAEGGK
jgi:L-methionine (R)-S-oxide reductase